MTRPKIQKGRNRPKPTKSRPPTKAIVADTTSVTTPEDTAADEEPEVSNITEDDDGSDLDLRGLFPAAGTTDEPDESLSGSKPELLPPHPPTTAAEEPSGDPDLVEPSSDTPVTELVDIERGDADPVELEPPSVEGTDAEPVSDPSPVVEEITTALDPTAHRFANLFPLMGGADFDGLVEDIRKHGLRKPILLFNGQILDGRNRLAACKQAGVEPSFEQFNGTEAEALALVISENLIRRQLTDAQKAAVATDFLAVEEELARQRMRAGRRLVPVVSFAGQPASFGAYVAAQQALNDPPPDPVEGLGTDRPEPVGEAADLVGRRFGIGKGSVRAAKAIASKAPEVLQAMRDGSIPTIGQAAKIAELPPETRTEVVGLPEPERRDRLRTLSKGPQQAPSRGTKGKVAMLTEADILEAATKLKASIDALPEAAALRVSAKLVNLFIDNAV